MSARFSLCVVAFMSALAGAGVVHAQTLTDALVSAYQSNPKLLEQRGELKIVDEKVAQAQTNWRPTISVQASDSYVDDRITGAATDVAAQAYLRNQYPGDSYGLTISQPLYRGGRTVAQLRQAKAEVKSGEAKLLAIEEEVLLQVVTDYLDLDRDQRLLELTSARRNDATSALSGAQAKLKGGEATRQDVATAQAALQDAMQAMAQAQASETTSRLVFARDTGLEPRRLAPVDPIAALPPNLEQAVQEAGENSFDVEAADYAVRAAREALTVAKGQALPTISFQGTLLHQDGVTFPGEGEDVEAASVQLKMPIYSGGLLASQTRAARLEVEAKRDALDEARRAAQVQAGSAWAQLDYTRKAEAGLATKAQAVSTSLEGARRQQIAGERTLADVIAAEEALFVVQIAQIQSHHDALLSQYTLADSVGRLTAEELKLPVSLFDPHKYLRRIGWAPGR